jgi:hypothetical protein
VAPIAIAAPPGHRPPQTSARTRPSTPLASRCVPPRKEHAPRAAAIVPLEERIYGYLVTRGRDASGSGTRCNPIAESPPSGPAPAAPGKAGVRLGGCEPFSAASARPPLVRPGSCAAKGRTVSATLAAAELGATRVRRSSSRFGRSAAAFLGMEGARHRTRALAALI